MSFEYYYITVVSLVIFVVALLIGIMMNNRYYRVIKESLTQVREAELKGPSAIGGDVEVLTCPRCGYSKTIPYRLGDYVGKVVDETCPNDGERLVVHAIYSSRPAEQSL
ncbi:hypothetical protein JCM16161A_04670 [Vulcanisaeta sp. JCM 16161]|uniref:hypothetical protein n=1 Tax=Vulcanisaeta sp. JCM 16161 TaxID=1295372 RepID=UPI0006D14B56|nr:hypothetical protein [Vulcanisaeta sp. JCM 16161]